MLKLKGTNLAQKEQVRIEIKPEDDANTLSGDGCLSDEDNQIFSVTYPLNISYYIKNIIDKTKTLLILCWLNLNIYEINSTYNYIDSKIIRDWNK